MPGSSGCAAHLAYFVSFVAKPPLHISYNGLVERANMSLLLTDTSSL